MYIYSYMLLVKDYCNRLKFEVKYVKIIQKSAVLIDHNRSVIKLNLIKINKKIIICVRSVPQ